jgi:hypothetical protein
LNQILFANEALMCLSGHFRAFSISSDVMPS